MRIEQLKLCLVTHFTTLPNGAYLELIEQAIRGGVTSIQLRFKQQTPAVIYPFACKLKSLLQQYHIPLIVNDHLELAKQIDAEGIHLGQSDISPYRARQELGTHKIIGLSVESWQDVDNANATTDIDYIGASAVFPTLSKTNCKMYWGLKGLTQIVDLSKHPVVAIGGIHTENVKAIKDSGAQGIAVISAIHNAPHPEQSARDLFEAMSS